jgi:hypothetical protein
MLDVSVWNIVLASSRMLMRFANGFVTVAFFPFLFRLYLRNRRRFYLLWGVGFLLYGANIVTSAIIDYAVDYEPTTIHWIIFVFYTVGFTCLITGTGDLIGRSRIALASSMLLLLVPLILYNVSSPEVLAWTITLSPYLLISLYLYYIRRRYGASVDLFIIGWMFLLLVNVATPMGMMNPIYVDLFAIIGKTIIFRGMMSPRFSFMADEMKRFLISGAPEVYTEGIVEHCTLVNPRSGQRAQELEWIRATAIENNRKGIRTILVAFYDLITSKELETNGLDEGDLYLVRMLPKGDGTIQVIGDSVATMSDDLNQLELLISEIIGYSKERGIRCDIVLYTLSWAIHTHGWKRVYSLLTSKMTDLKTSNVHIYFFYYPETHEKTEASKFENLVDRVLTI